MARKPVYDSLTHMVMYYTSLYYYHTEIDPSIRGDERSNTELVERLDFEYRRDLNRRCPSEWDNEDTREYFKSNMDFLTKAYKRPAEKKKLSEEKKSFVQDALSKMNMINKD